MTTYTAPIEDIKYALEHIADLESIATLPGLEEATPDLVYAVLEEAAKLAEEELASINHTGDLEGAHLIDGQVQCAKGWKHAYQAIVDGGWMAMPFPEDIGGQNLPWTLTLAVGEMWQASNMSFAIGPVLTHGAAELLAESGTDQQKALYLEKLVQGIWAGTMNLTEAAAGSDLGALKTKAVPEGDHYLITGQKIFITYDQDLTENIIHFVLARTPDAPAGIKGISLFLVPKFLVNDDGSLGEMNDVRPVSLEHKLGLHASPTCVMSFGDHGHCIGYKVGDLNRGLAAMFTMMNNARLSVGVQGLGIAERAYQQALNYARERVQGRNLASGDRTPVSIVHHPDVKRMLLSMRARVEAMRGLIYFSAAMLDRSKRLASESERRFYQSFVDLLTPLSKAWCTDLGVEVASTGLQIHGGMGYIEETGAAQHFRDSRIAPIYEGTNGIQALDLASRKLQRDGGQSVFDLIAHMKDHIGTNSAFSAPLDTAFATLEDCTRHLVALFPQNPNAVSAAAWPYLQLFGTVFGGWVLAHGAQSAANKGHSAAYLQARQAIARFYFSHDMTHVTAYAATIREGSLAVEEFEIERL